jgi:hypothetical protein
MMRARTIMALFFAMLLVGCPGEQATPVLPTHHSQPAKPAMESVIVDETPLPGVFVANGIRLELLAGGRYRMLVHAESANADLESKGAWTSSENGLHLTPDDSSEPAHDYVIRSPDALGASDRGQTLIREGER